MMYHECKHIEYLNLHNDKFFIMFLHIVDTENQIVFKSIFDSILTHHQDLWFLISESVIWEFRKAFLKIQILLDGNPFSEQYLKSSTNGGNNNGTNNNKSSKRNTK